MVSAPCGCEFGAKSFEAAADGCVEAHRAGLEDEAADQVGVDAAARLDAAARRLLDLADDVLEVRVGEFERGRQLDLEHALLGGDEAVELARDRPDLARATLLREQADEVDGLLVCVAEHVEQDLRLDALVELGVLEHRGELRHLVDGGREVGQLLAHGLEVVGALRGVEQRPRIHAVRDAQFWLPSSAEKSSSRIDSSIRRRWSASVSDFPVTFVAAIRVRSATSARICSSARRVSASTWRWVSSIRRCRSASASSRTRSRVESATRRASARISSESCRACPTSARCSSSSRRASSRAWSASSIDARIRSRRWSIIAWIGPKANRFSTKNVIANAMIVQIIRPGTTWIRALAATGISSTQTRT